MLDGKRTAKMRTGFPAHVAEELERRVMLSSAVAAFAPQVTFSVGSQPRGVVTADLNGDGKPDLVVTNGGVGNSVGVLSGNGNGSFGTQGTFAVGTTPFGVAVGDLNRDGRPDLVVANNGSGNVSVLLGNGNGTFGVQQQLAAGASTRTVVVGDVNGDGKPDLVAANYGAGTVSVMLGNGNGSFAGQQTFGAGSQASSIAAGDFNRDGRLDLAVSNKSAGTVSVLLGNGNGTFGGASAVGAGALPFSVVSGDVNGDGKPDLVVAEEANGVVGVILGNGNGAFAAQATYQVGAIACAVVVGDFNGDGKLDVACANYSSGSVSVLKGNGDGTFAGQRTFGVGTNPFSIASGDVNRDGRADLVVGNVGGNSVGVLVEDVAPYVTSINRLSPDTIDLASVSFAVTFSEAVTGVDATDFVLTSTGVTARIPVGVSGGGANYTVTLDGVAGSGSGPANSGTLELDLVNDGSIHDLGGNALQAGGTATYTPQATVGGFTQPQSVTSGDFDRDGKTDLAVADGSNVNVLIGNGDGTFKAASTFAAGTSLRSAVVGDFNGDGIPDVAANGNGIGVLLGNGDGTFRLVTTFYAAGDAGYLAVADMNADGRADLVVGTTAYGVVDVRWGNGDGTFQSSRTFSYMPGNAMTGLAVGDVNGDGNPDVVYNDSDQGCVGVMLGNRTGLGVAQTFACSPSGYSVGLADFNGDGKLDVAVPCNVRRAVDVLPGNGDGTFGAQWTFSTGNGANVLLSADLNNDGRPDLAVLDQSYNQIDTVLGNGNGTFGSFLTNATSYMPYAACAADLNGDGKPDLVVANRFGNSLTVLMGRTDGNFEGQTYQVYSPHFGNTLTSFASGAAGTTPRSGLVEDAAGDLFGTTYSGGPGNVGGVYEIAAGSSTPRTLAWFNGVNGANPRGSILLDANGNIFGTTEFGGSANDGTVFELAHGSATITTLGTFTGDNGANPQAGVIMDGAGNLYGPAEHGGPANRGTVFELAAGTGTIVALASFDDSNGIFPCGGLYRDAAGNLFGTTAYGGPQNFGTVFELGQGQHAVTVLHSFTGSDGQVPLSGLVADASGNVFGTTSTGDMDHLGGVVFELPGGGSSVVTVATIPGRTYGAMSGGLAINAQGDLFGATSGMVYQLSHGSNTVGPLAYVGNGEAVGGTVMLDPSGNVFVPMGATGEVYAVTRYYYYGTVNGGTGGDQIVLRQRDRHFVTWSLNGGPEYGVAIGDFNGLSESNPGANDVITLDYTNGNPLPNVVHLNGTFTINGLQGASPLAGTKLEIGRSLVRITYNGSSPAAVIRGALSAGYNGGAWNGTSPNGVITSSVAAANANHNTGIAWADSGDGTGVNTVANSVELKYTLNGDTNLNGTVDIFDLNALLAHYNKGGDWTGGDSTYNGVVDIFDLNGLLGNYNTSLGSQAVGASKSTAAAGPTMAFSTVTAEAVNAAGGSAGIQAEGVKLARKQKRVWKR